MYLVQVLLYDVRNQVPYARNMDHRRMSECIGGVLGMRWGCIGGVLGAHQVCIVRNGLTPHV